MDGEECKLLGQRCRNERYPIQSITDEIGAIFSPSLRLLSIIICIVIFGMQSTKLSNSTLIVCIANCK